MILVIDNYDSFAYNLFQYVGELGFEPVVYRNDRITLDQIKCLKPSHIIISPGPCTPLESGISNDIIRHFAGIIPVLGVCLGCQCITHVYGGKIVRAVEPVHGKSSLIYHDGKTVYRDLPNPFEAGRYHSLVSEPDNFPPVLEISARTDDGVIMGVRHRELNIEGVQFHPESIMTDTGHAVLRNFLECRQSRW